jgi:hypothetical protein
MNSLERLFRRQLADPVEEQDRIRRGFLEALGESHLRVRVEDGPIHDDGIHVVVGLMVAWNDYDRRLALALDRAVESGRAGTDTIEVFDGDSILTQEDLTGYIPDLGEATMQEPWVGVWKDGRPWFTFCGPAATAWLQDRYGMTNA